MKFYTSFVDADSLQEKQSLVKEISHVTCQCRDDYETEKASQKVDKNIYQRLEEETKKLKKEFDI